MAPQLPAMIDRLAECTFGHLIWPSPFLRMSTPTTGLNSAQLEAVNYVKGPCLVLAGAGSGKTRVITQKIARLIEVGLEPKRIAAITFTNKAASEMRERARKLIGKGAQEVMICTFHALGVRIMRQDGHVLGLKPQFSILDADDVVSILKDCGGTTDANTARQWQWAISAWKNAGLTGAQAELVAKNENERVAARIMGRYEERLSAYQSVDFDDLIGLPLKLLGQFPEVREPGSKEFKRISWEEALTRIAKRMKADRDKNFVAKNADGLTVNRWNTFGMLVSSASNNESGYMTAKILRSMGVVALDTQARI